MIKKLKKYYGKFIQDINPSRKQCHSAIRNNLIYMLYTEGNI